MKKNLFKMAGVVALTFAMSACTKDVLDLDKTLKFTALSVEKQKEAINESGNDFIENMNEVENSDGFKALSELNSSLSPDDAATAPMALIISKLKSNALTQDINALENIDKQIRSAASSSNPNSLENVPLWGEFVWNSTSKEFDKVKVLYNQTIYSFPSSSKSTTNDATLNFDYKEVIVQNSYMPESYSLKIKIGQNTILSFDYAATYDPDKTVTKEKNSLTIDKFNWNYEFKNNKKEISAKMTIKNGQTTLVKYEIGSAGVFTYNTMGNLSFDADNIKNPNSNGGILPGGSNAVNSGSMYFQVMDVAMLGGFKDYQAFYNELQVLSEKNTSYDEAYYNDQAKIYNKYLIMYAFFVKENNKFADVEYFNEITTEPYKMYALKPRLILSDDSKVSDFNKYAADNFKTLNDKYHKVDSIFNDVKRNYDGDYYYEYNY